MPAVFRHITDPVEQYEWTGSQKYNQNTTYFAGVWCDDDLPCVYSSHQAVQTVPGEQDM